MRIDQLKRREELKVKYRAKISRLEDEIADMNHNKEFNQLINAELGKTWWEEEMDKIYRYEDEVIKINLERIEEIKQEEREELCKVLEKF